MKEINIRRATLADLKTIQDLNHELCVKENAEFDSTIDPNYPFSKEGNEYFKYRIEKDDSITLIAEADGIAVGYVAGGLVRKEYCRKPLIIAESENTFVKENYRNKGIGGKLAAGFEDWCREKGVQRIRHVASAANEKAIKFYKANGAEEISIMLEKNIDV